MASTVPFTTIVIVVLTIVNCEQPFLRNSKVVPQHWQHDKEELGGHMEQVPRGPQIKAGPLRAHLSHDQWQAPVQAANTDEGLLQVRVNLLKSKLMPQNFQQHKVVAHRKPFPKPDTEGHNRHKRYVEQTQFNDETETLREKREVVINPHGQPEIVMQPHILPALEQDNEIQYQERVAEKREKRQIIYLINQRPMWFMKRPRTTPNPFNREVNIADYEIVRPTPEGGFIPAAVDTDEEVESYQLSETSELEYESDYTISMSDSEDWGNYPLTTPSGPNPGWRLSTMADIYQRPKQKRVPIRVQEVPVLTRVKRSPKQAKRRIGAYKEKLKQYRKRKDMRTKRRIITKEDKARMKAQENVKEEEDIENLLQKPRTKQRKTTYSEEKLSKEILWSNDTHRIVEDPGAKMKWINKTHYHIFKENATDDWYSQDHILMYGEEYMKNKTGWDDSAETNEITEEEDVNEDEEYSEDYDEEFTKEEEEEKGIRKKDKKIKDESIKKDKKSSIVEKESEEEINLHGENDNKDEKSERQQSKEDKAKIDEGEGKQLKSKRVRKEKERDKNVKKTTKKKGNKVLKKEKGGDEKKDKKSQSKRKDKQEPLSKERGKDDDLGWEEQIDKSYDNKEEIVESIGILSDEGFILESKSISDKKPSPKKKSSNKKKPK